MSSTRFRSTDGSTAAVAHAHYVRGAVEAKACSSLGVELIAERGNGRLCLWYMKQWCQQLSMRVCFETLCFSSQRLAEDEDDPNVAPSQTSGEPLVVMDPVGDSQQELQVLLQTKDLRIRDLEAQLRLREQEILELRSHLDKFQSVFPYHIKNNQLRPRKKRAQGISAEPQSHSTIQELSEQSFPVFDKNDR